MLGDLVERVEDSPTAAGSTRRTSTDAPRRRKALIATAAAAILVIGGIAWWQHRPKPISQRGYAPELTLAGVGAGSPIAAAQPAPPVGPAAPTGADAVRRFLDGEMSGDLATSFTQLDLASRQQIGRVDDWEASSGEHPTYLSYTITSETADQVVVEAQIQPRVDALHGVVPGSATVRFGIAAEDGGARISLDGTKIDPHYPERALAGAVATEWVVEAQKCPTGGTASAGGLEYDGSLLGTIGLAESLCQTTGSPRAAKTQGLDGLADPSPVLSAFGGDASGYTAVVTVDGVVGRPSFQVVLAPLGTAWIVIGAFGT